MPALVQPLGKAALPAWSEVVAPDTCEKPAESLLIPAHVAHRAVLLVGQEWTPGGRGSCRVRAERGHPPYLLQRQGAAHRGQESSR